jgi:hypothetical protein
VGVLYIHTQGHVQRKGKPVIIVENRIISPLFVEENKNKRDHRDTLNQQLK